MLVTALLAVAAASARTPSGQSGTDANIVTAIDVSDSIGRYEEWLQQTGLAHAVLDPEFLRAATSGPNRQIGFAVFTWSSDGQFSQLVPWTTIRSRDDAARVSALIASATLIDRTHYGGGDHEQRRGAQEKVQHERRTDLSAAIDFAALLLRSAPHESRRAVMNICTNGVDNVEDGIELSRDIALASGLTINGLALGHDQRVVRYLEASVIGGPGAFVMALSDARHANEAMAAKLIRDLRVSANAVEHGGINPETRRSSP